MNADRTIELAGLYFVYTATQYAKHIGLNLPTYNVAVSIMPSLMPVPFLSLYPDYKSRKSLVEVCIAEAVEKGLVAKIDDFLTITAKGNKRIPESAKYLKEPK